MNFHACAYIFLYVYFQGNSVFIIRPAHPRSAEIDRVRGWDPTVKPLLEGTPIWGFVEAIMPKLPSRGKNTIPLLLYGVASTCMVRAVL